MREESELYLRQRKSRSLGCSPLDVLLKKEESVIEVALPEM